MERKLGIHLMTHRPEMMENLFMATVHNIKEIAPISRFGISFNGNKWEPGQIESIVKRLEDMGFEVRYKKVEDQTQFMKNFQILKYRSNCIDLLEGCKYWLILDDDMKFGAEIPHSVQDNRSSGKQYLDIVNYFDSHSKCGCFQVVGYLGTRKHPGKSVHLFDFNNQSICTGRGLFMRNLLDHPELRNKLVYDDMIEMRGAYEESTIALTRLMNGYYIARMTCGRTQHFTSTQLDQKGHWSDLDILNADDGFVGTMRRKFNIEIKLLGRGVLKCRKNGERLDPSAGIPLDQIEYKF